MAAITAQEQLAADFMHDHGEQVLTSLRQTLEFWEKGAAIEDAAPGIKALAEDQVRSWSAILRKAERVVDGE